MPAEFIVQHPDVANPPTLFLPLAAAAARLRSPASTALGDEAARAEALDRAQDLAFLRAGVTVTLLPPRTTWHIRMHASQAY